MVYFDETYYLQSKLAQLESIGQSKRPDGAPWTETNLKAIMRDQGMTPQEHYLRYGRAEGLNPNPYFNETEYLQAKTDQLNSVQELKPGANTFSVWTVADTLKAITNAGMIPAEHYERYGCYETDSMGRYIDPSNVFDTQRYWFHKLVQLDTTDPNGDWPMEKMLEAFKTAGLSPVSHYMHYGKDEFVGSDLYFLSTINGEAYVTVEQNPASFGGKSVEVFGNINKDKFAEVALGADGIVSVINGKLIGTPTLGSSGWLSAGIDMGEGELRFSVASSFTDENATIVGSVTTRNNATIAGTIGAFKGGSNNDIITVVGGDVAFIDSGSGNDSITVSDSYVSQIWFIPESNSNYSITVSDYSYVQGIAFDTGTYSHNSITVSGGSRVNSIEFTPESDGNNSITVSEHAEVNYLACGSGGDTITISENANVGTIYGESGNNSITISENAYATSLRCGGGDDSLTISENAKAGIIFGGSGNDSITISDGSSVLEYIFADAGNDIITISNSSVLCPIDGGPGNDVITVNGSTVSYIYGGDGNDIITFDAHSTLPSYSYIAGGTGADTISLGGQNIWLRYNSGDTGAYDAAGGTINTTAFDVIKGIGSSVTFDGKGLSSTVSLTLPSNPTMNGGMYLVKGAYNESSNTFGASGLGESTLLIFDTDVSAATNFEAVVLAGVTVASASDVDFNVGSFTINFA